MKPLILTLLLLGLTIPTQAAEKFGDWYIGNPTEDPALLYALTANDSQQLFGQYCYPGTGKCVWLLVIDKTCIKGDPYVVLINSEAGAISTELLCDVRLDGGRYRYIFTGFDDIDRVVRAVPRVGIVVPVKGGTFTVVRFSLKGAVDALAAMHADNTKRRRSTPTTPDTSTRDLKL